MEAPKGLTYIYTNMGPVKQQLFQIGRPEDNQVCRFLSDQIVYMYLVEQIVDRERNRAGAAQALGNRAE